MLFKKSKFNPIKKRAKMQNLLTGFGNNWKEIKIQKSYTESDLQRKANALARLGYFPLTIRGFSGEQKLVI